MNMNTTKIDKESGIDTNVDSVKMYDFFTE